MAEPEFTHLDSAGHARMVDVGGKSASRRRAVARCSVTMSQATSSALSAGTLPKGDVLAAVRIAGIQAAKRTADLIPLCHPLALSAVSVDVTVGEGRADIAVTVETTDRTGVEMEALTGCAVAALTLYDMAKSADKGMVIGDLALWEKSGGASGDYSRAEPVGD